MFKKKYIKVALICSILVLSMATYVGASSAYTFSKEDGRFKSIREYDKTHQ